MKLLPRTGIRIDRTTTNDIYLILPGKGNSVGLGLGGAVFHKQDLFFSINIHNNIILWHYDPGKP